MPLLVIKLYRIINAPDWFGSGIDAGNIFQSVEAAAGTSIVMVVLGAYVRIGCDELWNWKSTCMFVSGIISYLGSLACFVLLLVDLGNASHGITDGYLLRSFFYVWIGYPVVSLTSIGVRLSYKCFRSCGEYAGPDRYNGGVPEFLSLFKDSTYGLLDCYSKGILALWTAYSAFGETLINNAPATPYAWPGAAAAAAAAR